MLNPRWLLLCLLPFLLTGCWDKLEIEEQAYVVVLGVEKSKQEGEFDVTLQIANPQVGSTDRSQAPQEPASDILTITVPDIISAKDTANAIVTRKVTFAHLKTFIVSEELARTTAFDSIISSAIRDRQLRREINIIVCDGKASSFIQHNKPRLETRPHKYFELMQKRWRETGLVPYSTFNKYFERSEGRNSIFLAIYASENRKKTKKNGQEDDFSAGQVPEKSGDPVQIIGSAVIKGGKMIDVMTGEETRITMLLQRKVEAENWQATYPDPLNSKYRVAARLMKEKDVTLDMDLSGEQMKIDVTVPLTLQLLSIPSRIDYVKDERKQQILQASIEKGLEKKVMAFIKKTQEKYSDDPFKWSLEARKKFWTSKAYYAYNWDEKYKHAQIKVNFKINLEDFGKSLRPPETRTGAMR